MKSETVSGIKLTLNNEEALWLKSIMQNPLFSESPEKEDTRDKEMRKIFWKALGGIIQNDSFASIRV